MRKTIKLLSYAAFAGVFLITACNNTTSEKVEEKMDTMANNAQNAMNNMTDDKNDSADDAEFVRDIAKSNDMELHMLAQGRTMGTDAELKSNAKKMEADHKKLAQQVKEYAASKNITLDTADMDHDMDKNDKKGADWDKKWADDMVDEHEKDIKKFEDEQDDVLDPALKDMITNTLPILRSHLDMSKKLQEKLNK